MTYPATPHHPADPGDPAVSDGAGDRAALPALPALPARHPVTAAVTRWLTTGPVPPDRPLIVACSGGADSLALAAATRRAVSPARRLSAAIVDHGLQPGSALTARAAAEQLRHLGYDRIDLLTVEVTGPGGMESAARDARYRALAELASSSGAAVLLAHTADDQAETVLLGLARGSGPRSIAGMRPWREPWGRPLLAIRRRDTEDACARLGLAPWHDPHNADPSFTRVRLRHEVLPLLDEVLGGGVVAALARTADLMAEDLSALDALAAAIGADAVAADGTLTLAAVAPHPPALRRRVLRSWIADRAGISTLTHQHLLRLDGIVIQGRSRQAVRLPGGIDVIRRGARLIIAADER